MNPDAELAQGFVFTTLVFGQILFASSMTLLGVVSHFLKKVVKDKIAKPIEYWSNHWPQSVLSIVGAVVGCIILIHINESSMLAFFGVGYAADSVLNKAGQAANRVNL